MMRDKNKMSNTEKLEIKKKILDFLLNFDEKDVLYKVNELHNLEDKLAKSIINEVWQDANKLYDVPTYCICPRPDRESGFSYCSKCHYDVSGQRIEEAVILQEHFWELVKNDDNEEDEEKVYLWLRTNNRIGQIIYSMSDFSPFRKEQTKETPQDDLIGTIYGIAINVDHSLPLEFDKIVTKKGKAVLIVDMNGDTSYPVNK